MNQLHAIGIEKVLIRCLSTELQQECHEAPKEAWAAKTGAKTTRQTTATGTLLPLEFADRMATKGFDQTSAAHIRKAISLHGECPFPESASVRFASTAKVRFPPTFAIHRSAANDMENQTGHFQFE